MASKTEHIEFRTSSEIDKDKRWDDICGRYRDLLKLSGQRIAPSRLFVMIATEKNMSSQQVRNIVVNRGLYIPKAKV